MRQFYLLLIFAPLFAWAQPPFNSGSDGSLGPLVVTADTRIALPPDGVLNYTTISITGTSKVTFLRNEINTPVYMLATGDVSIGPDAEVNIQGEPGGPGFHGLGGPGGGDGGIAPYGGLPGGDGHGPGGGPYSTSSSLTFGKFLNTSKAYGNRTLIPLLGGSGGGAYWSSSNLHGGSGGAGAVLIASSSQVIIDGAINAGGMINLVSILSRGSSGAIRLVAPLVTGTGDLIVTGGGDNGRIRIDTYNFPATVGLDYNEISMSIGSNMVAIPANQPSLSIIGFGATGIPTGTLNNYDITLPAGSSSNQVVQIQADNFEGIVPVDVVLTPESGNSTTFTGSIDMAGGTSASTSVNVTLTPGLKTRIQAWVQR